MTICEKIFQLMKDKGIKQTDISNALGIQQSVVGSWKARNTDPPAKYLKRICEILDTPVYDILDIESDLTQDEIILLENYRKASAKERAVVNMILAQDEAAGAVPDHDQELDAEP